MSRLAGAQTLWRRLAPAGLRRLAGPALMWAAWTYALARGRPRPGVGATGPLKLVGLFSASHGIGAAARLVARAFQALDIPVEQVEAGASGFDFRRRLPAPTRGVWMFYMNPNEMVAALASLGPGRVVGPRFGHWAWELPKAPPSWFKAATLVDEVWAPSQFTAKSLEGSGAVRVVPYPLFQEDYAGVEPAPRRAPFQALALFDFNSSVARKNPQGVIAAFREAFGDDGACELTLKTQNGAQHPVLLADLQALAGGNVRIVDESWPYAQVKALIAGADVLISLHRAEGLGLVIAEAMALGTPVIATGFSGPVDFVDETCGLVIPYRLVEAVDPQGVYGGGQSWAEPDIAAAATALVRLRTDPELRRRLAIAGRRRVAERFSPQAWFATLPPAVQQAARAATSES